MLRPSDSVSQSDANLLSSQETYHIKNMVLVDAEVNPCPARPGYIRF